ncbi:hypothetical protein [Gallaecimonas xiamenensis]|uniref:Uncharacterized protein n=1 Tax=Gallaecimonas xiamenensis 3-C-1 TaxID=745411 RepID=K2IDP2_9GAMM|nr:hypothetical protein [Gallaecimonas xiamenensis]EKE68096.1 hypothetical protein B3C1_17407 [Gallaecimonas xiamenensis 3-C-1]
MGTRLYLGQESWLGHGDRRWALPQPALDGEPPTAMALEAAIGQLEEVIMPLARDLPPGTALKLDGPGANAFDLPLALAAVEAAFGDLARAAERRSYVGGPAFSPAQVSWLLTLREVMHHLGFTEASRA